MARGSVSGMIGFPSRYSCGSTAAPSKLGIGSTTAIVNGHVAICRSASVTVSVYVVRGWSSVGVPVMVPSLTSVGSVRINPSGKAGVSA